MKFSIIMPVYNSINTLEKSIKSILNQTYSDLELIIIDDGSTDNTLDYCNDLANKDNRVKVYHQDNLGPGKARNCGIEKSTGDYIAFIDSDDYYENDFLELVNNLLKDKKYDFIFINTINEKTDGTFINCDNISKHKNCSKKELLSMQMMGVIPWGPCSKVCKSELIKKVSFSDLSVGEEAIYSFDLLMLANEYGFISKPLYHYVHNVNGQHTKGGNDPWKPMLDAMKIHLERINKLEEFKYALNSLALKSLSIAIYRYANFYKYSIAKNKIKETIDNYKNTYDLKKIDLRNVDKKTKIIKKFINYKLYFLLYIASKARKKIND